MEVQHTFYEPPADALLARWRRQVPVGFEFRLKAWQLITPTSSSPTYRRMKVPLAEEDRGEVGAFRSTPPVLRARTRTLECAQVLRATAVLLQCPASFRPTSENIAGMTAFLSTAPRQGLRVLWEPEARGRSSCS